MRELLLDDGFPTSLALELERRGRPARTVRDAALEGATDAELLAGARDAVVVTTEPGLAERRPPGATVAVIAARGEAARRELVHRHAHAIATQRPGSARRYGA